MNRFMNGMGQGPFSMGPRQSYGNFMSNTNKIPVNSLEDALSRYTDFNSNIAYWDTERNIIYDIYTDGRGNKTYDIFNVSKANIQQDIPVNNYDERLAKLEIKMEELYGKYNAQQSAGTTTVPIE